MTSERVAHQCHADGCDSGAVYATKVGLDVAAPGVRYPVRMLCTIKVCERHKDEERIRRYLLLDHNREMIITGLTEEGHPEPDFLSMRILFERLEPNASVLLNRPALRCDRVEGDVTCKKTAKWQVVQLFRMMWQRGKGPPQVKVLTKMCVCDEHKAITRARDFLDRDSQSRTLEWLNARGVSMPDFKTMQIEFEPIDGERLDPKSYVGEDGPLDQFKIAPKGEMG